MLPDPEAMVGFIRVTIPFSITTESNVVLSSAVTPVISTNDGENSSSNCSSLISKSFSIPIEMTPSPYALPTPSWIVAVANIISLYSTSKVIKSPGSDILSIRSMDGSP